MRLTIRHLTEYSYHPAAARVGLCLKLFPGKTKAQTPGAWNVTVNGEAIVPKLTNGFGDSEALWFSTPDASKVAVEAEGVVVTSDTAGLIDRYGFAVPAIFLRQTPLTRVDGAIRRIADAAIGDDPLTRMHALSAAVHEAMIYRPGVTDGGTTAAQALALGAGVCQDKAHLFIAAARAADIPARYVVGYLLDNESPLAETHAWAEVHLQDLGWVGFDPTNQICPTDAYVRLCAGLDANDAAPIRGSIQGGAQDSLIVSVEIAQAQAQQ